MKILALSGMVHVHVRVLTVHFFVQSDDGETALGNGNDVLMNDGDDDDDVLWDVTRDLTHCGDGCECFDDSTW